MRLLLDPHVVLWQLSDTPELGRSAPDAIAPEDGLAVARLPMHHRDPFDRLLVAQAARGGLTLMTADSRLRAYDVPVVDAIA